MASNPRSAYVRASSAARRERMGPTTTRCIVAHRPKKSVRMRVPSSGSRRPSRSKRARVAPTSARRRTRQDRLPGRRAPAPRRSLFPRSTASPWRWCRDTDSPAVFDDRIRREPLPLQGDHPGRQRESTFGLQHGLVQRGDQACHDLSPSRDGRRFALADVAQCRASRDFDLGDGVRAGASGRWHLPFRSSAPEGNRHATLWVTDDEGRRGVRSRHGRGNSAAEARFSSTSPQRRPLRPSGCPIASHCRGGGGGGVLGPGDPLPHRGRRHRVLVPETLAGGFQKLWPDLNPA